MPQPANSFFASVGNTFTGNNILPTTGNSQAISTDKWNFESLPQIQRINRSDFSSPAAQATFYNLAEGYNHASSDVRSLFKDYKGDDKELILFVLPHDDDGIIGAGLTLVNLIKAKVPVALLIATDGRSGYSSEREKSSIVAIREKETIDSARILGLFCDDGLSAFDRSVKRLASKILPYAARILPSSLIERLFNYSYDSASMVRFLNIPDGASSNKLGKNFEQALVRAFRKGFKVDGQDRQPSRIIYPTGNDAHIDHQNLAKEILISVFHAAGKIWGDTCGTNSLASIPELIEMLVYCRLPENQAPNLLIHGTQEDQDKVISGLNAYVSQLANIPSMVARVKKYPYEFLKSAPPPLFSEEDRERYLRRFTDSELKT